MGLRFSNRIVLPSSPFIPPCDTPVREIATQNVRVSVANCCIWDVEMCLPQGADKTFTMTDSEAVDYTGALEITFDVWTAKAAGTSLLSYSLTGGDISLVTDYRFTFSIDSATSEALAAGRWYCEAWVTLSDGRRRIVGAGPFIVEDTRKYD